MDSIVAREGMEQRVVPTGMAARDNEIEQRRNFSEKHFPGVAPCGFHLDGHDGGAARDASRPSVCYPVRGSVRAVSGMPRLGKRGNVAETPCYPLIQASLAAIRQQQARLSCMRG